MSGLEGLVMPYLANTGARSGAAASTLASQAPKPQAPVGVTASAAIEEGSQEALQRLRDREHQRILRQSIEEGGQEAFQTPRGAVRKF